MKIVREKIVNEIVQITDKQVIRKDDPARWDDEEELEEADEEGAKMAMTHMRADQIK